MAITYRVDPDAGIVHITIDGRLTPVALAETLREVCVTPQFNSDTHYLVDWRAGDDSNTSEEIRAMADAVQRMAPQSAGGRCAIVVRSDVQYGLTRVFTAFAGDQAIEFRSYRKVDEALAWLAGGSNQPAPP